MKSKSPFLTTLEMYENFGSYFDNGLNNKYVLIGGSALEILSKRAGATDTRGTKDFDIVFFLDDENTNSNFVKKLWEYIKDGEYDIKEKYEKDRRQFYRFRNPKDNIKFPKQLEFFSRSNNLEGNSEDIFTIINPDDDISSLSAIVLNDEYYNFLKENCETISGVTCVNEIALLILKTYAYINKVNSGENAENPDVAKHKMDVFFILDIIDPNLSIEINDFPTIRENIILFNKIISTQDDVNINENIKIIESLFNL